MVIKEAKMQGDSKIKVYEVTHRTCSHCGHREVYSKIVTDPQRVAEFLNHFKKKDES